MNNCKCGNDEFVKIYEFGRTCIKCGKRFYLDENNNWCSLGTTFYLGRGNIEFEIYPTTDQGWCCKCRKLYPKGGCLNCKFKGIVAERKLNFDK